LGRLAAYFWDTYADISQDSVQSEQKITGRLRESRDECYRRVYADNSVAGSQKAPVMVFVKKR
jgi:hypothetical protein